MPAPALTLALALLAAPPSLGPAYDGDVPAAAPAPEVAPGSYDEPAGSPAEAVRCGAGRLLAMVPRSGRYALDAAGALPPVRTAPPQRKVRLPQRS